MSESPDVLNRDCHADVRIMYRQRFFSENSAKLVQGFDAAPQGTRRWLVALLFSKCLTFPALLTDCVCRLDLSPHREEA